CAIVYNSGIARQNEIVLYRQLFGSPAAEHAPGFSASPAQLMCRSLARDLAAALGDQPRRALVAGVDPEPAQCHAEAVAQADQEVDVGEAPDPPGEIAAHLHPAEIDHRF